MSNYPTTDELIELMSDGEFHSGEELGKLLSVSRAAIWKRLEKLKELGLEYESIRGKGYRLKSELSLLNQAEIKQNLSENALNNLTVLPIVDSTNAEILRQLADNKIKLGDVVLAEMQNRGRGRRGRSWVSPYAASINMSLYWRFEQGLSAVDGLSLVVGLAVVEVLNEVLNDVQPGFQLKWPNDIVFNGRKVAGILIELSGDPNGIYHIVIGIGINVNIISSSLFKEVNQPWISLVDITGQVSNRNILVADIINRLNRYLTDFQVNGFSFFQETWRKYDSLLDNEVFVHLGSDIIYGVAVGVSATGELMVKTDKGVELFTGGEVSLRKKL